MHTLKAIPIGELVRSKRNCSDSGVFQMEVQNICERLTQRKYPKWMFNRATEKVATMPREQLLKDKTMSGISNKSLKNKVSVFSTPYGVEFKHISSIINKYIPVLHVGHYNMFLVMDSKLPEKHQHMLIFFPSLIKSSYPKNLTWLHYPGCFKYSHNRCICCNIEVSRHFISTVKNKQYAVKQFINCNTIRGILNYM